MLAAVRLFTLVWLALSVLATNAFADKPSNAEPVVIHGKLLQMNAQTLKVAIDGKTRTFSTSLLNKWRINRGKIQIQFNSGITLSLSAGVESKIDTPWREIDVDDYTRHQHKASLSIVQDRKGQTMARERIKQIERIRRDYRLENHKHQKRMHKWLSVMENAKKAGVKSSVINNESIFETRKLAKASENKLAELKFLLGQLQSTANRIAKVGRSDELVDKFNARLRKARTVRTEIAHADYELARNISLNANVIQSELGG